MIKTIELIGEDKEIQSKFLLLEEDANSTVFERSEEIHTAILAILSRRHHFQLGPPGVAKSYLVEEILDRIAGLDENSYFKWLLTKFTVPEELFGGPDFNLLREKGLYKRITDKKLPRACFAFVDETYKGSSSVLNTLLKIMNEREFDNVDDDPTVPLLSLFGASNELPATNELDALADRFTFYHQVSRIRDMGSFMNMIEQNKTTEHIVSLDDIYLAQKIVDSVVIPDEVKDALWTLRVQMHQNDVLVSDRRLFQALAVIKAEAFMNGRSVAQVIDTKPLQHVMWRDVSHIDIVRKTVLDLADPLEREALDLLANIELAISAFREAAKDTHAKTVKTNAALEAWEKFKHADKELKALRSKEDDLGRKCPALDKVTARKVEMQKILLEEGLNLDSSSIQLKD